MGPKSFYFDTPLAFNAPDGGKILHGGQRMASVYSGEEIVPKGSTL